MSLAELPELIGFFSYSREDDKGSAGRLTKLRECIHEELRSQLGRRGTSFSVWQDKVAIAEGTLWENRIRTAVAQSVFFVPIVTPTAIKSEHCRTEFDLFLSREQELGRDDLVFPILYIRVPQLEDEAQWRDDPVLRVVGQRQYLDWRELRYRAMDSHEVGVAIDRFCRSIHDALSRPWLPPEERRKYDEEEVERKREEEEAQRHKEEEIRQQKKEADARRLKEVEDARLRKEEEEAWRQKEEKEARRRKEEVARRQREEKDARERKEEARRKKEVPWRRAEATRSTEFESQSLARQDDHRIGVRPKESARDETERKATSLYVRDRSALETRVAAVHPKQLEEEATQGTEQQQREEIETLRKWRRAALGTAFLALAFLILMLSLR
jgi:hypothetical protein